MQTVVRLGLSVMMYESVLPTTEREAWKVSVSSTRRSSEIGMVTKTFLVLWSKSNIMLAVSLKSSDTAKLGVIKHLKVTVVVYLQTSKKFVYNLHIAEPLLRVTLSRMLVPMLPFNTETFNATTPSNSETLYSSISNPIVATVKVRTNFVQDSAT